jgi:endonuclease YncB( thermonuclease family)
MHVTHIARRLGPTLADVILPDGTNVNHTLVKDGWCWWYRKYAAAHHSLVQSLPPHPPTPPVTRSWTSFTCLSVMRIGGVK